MYNEALTAEIEIPSEEEITEFEYSSLKETSISFKS